jgi:hypothetical protein
MTNLKLILSNFFSSVTNYFAPKTSPIGEMVNSNLVSTTATQVNSYDSIIPGVIRLSTSPINIPAPAQAAAAYPKPSINDNWFLSRIPNDFTSSSDSIIAVCSESTSSTSSFVFSSLSSSMEQALGFKYVQVDPAQIEVVKSTIDAITSSIS